jgi:uncharacterized protein (TIGR00369 family)
MIRDGLVEGEATDHFASRPWAADFARHAFDADPREFARTLIEELLRSGAARRSGGRLLGAEVVEVGKGTCVVEVPFADGITQQESYFHGAVTGAIADTAGGYAAMTLAPPDREVLTVEYKVNFLAPVHGEKLVARGEVVTAGRRLFVCRAEVSAV